MEFINSAYLLRLPSDKESIEKLKILAQDKGDLQELDKEEYLLCRHCHQIITSTAEMIEVQNSHQHTFVNPEGILFEIGCFGRAKGCWHVGYSTEVFSWFKGFRWRVAVCCKCFTHLGWLYTSFGNESFHGLILNCLVYSPDNS